MKNLQNDNINLQKQLEAMQDFLVEKVKGCFMGKTVADIKATIEYDQQDVLDWLMEISLEHECFEICTAVKKLCRHVLPAGSYVYLDYIFLRK